MKSGVARSRRYLLEYIRKFLYPHIFSHLLSTDELNVLKSYSNFTARISLSPPFPPVNSRKGKRRGRIIKQRTVGWIVGTWPKSGLGYLRTPGWGKIRQWITGPLYVASYYSLFHTALETRRVTQIPNTCAAFCREVCTVGAEGGEYIPPAPSSFPLGKRNNNGRANGERDVWRVLVHKIRPVSLKPVVQDIGRAYIKNRHRDEWIPENPSSGIVVPPTTFREGSLYRPLFFDCYRCCIARWLSSSANLSNFSRGFRHEQPLSYNVYRSF